MSRVRIGVMGCADIARRRMLPAFAAAAGAEVAAVASRHLGQAEEAARRFGGRPVGSYAALLQLEDVEAVYLPLPAALHADWVEAALLAGKHVLAEKPLTTDVSRTERLLSLAATRRLALLENVMFVHHGQHATVRRLLAEGVIGELRSLHAAFAVPRRPDHDIRYQAALGGGALWDVGVYPACAARYFLGDHLAVAGAALSAGPGREVDTSGAVLLRTPHGAFAHLTFGLDHAYRSTYALWGSAGVLSLDHAFTPPADHRPVVRIERQEGLQEIRLDADDQVARTVEAFVTAVRTGSTQGDDCLRQARLLADIRRAAGAPEPAPRGQATGIPFR